MQRDSKWIRAFVAGAAMVSLAACKTETAAAPISATPAAQAEKVVGPPEVAWKDMTKEQRGKYMFHVVMPRMQPLFAAFDPKEFEKISCKTCHGAGVDDKSFKMPSADLPKLPASQEGWAELQKEHPEALKFMAEKVKPEMAKLLGAPEFDPANPTVPGAVGCMACHAM